MDFLNRVQLISSKPVVYLVNLPEKAYIKKKSKWLPKVPQPLQMSRSTCAADEDELPPAKPTCAARQRWFLPHLLSCCLPARPGVSPGVVA